MLSNHGHKGAGALSFWGHRAQGLPLQAYAKTIECAKSLLCGKVRALDSLLWALLFELLARGYAC